MRIRTEQELFDKIDEELSWRRADMLRYRKVILSNDKSSSALVVKTLLRTAIPIIYAHWEGFIKETSLAYFNYVSVRKLSYKSLSKGFLSLYLQNEFINSSSISGFEKALSIINFFEKELEDRSDIRGIPEPIKTRSNLNSSILKEITLILELDYEKFRGYEAFIDAKLLEARNKIAHGEYRDIDWELYDEVYNIVLKLLSEFRDQLQNNIVLKRYIKPAETS